MMVNAGKSHSCGIEAALKGQLFDGKLDWAMSYGYTRSKFDKYVVDISWPIISSQHF